MALGAVKQATSFSKLKEFLVTYKPPIGTVRSKSMYILLGFVNDAYNQSAPMDSKN